MFNVKHNALLTNWCLEMERVDQTNRLPRFVLTKTFFFFLSPLSKSFEINWMLLYLINARILELPSVQQHSWQCDIQVCKFWRCGPAPISWICRFRLEETKNRWFFFLVLMLFFSSLEIRVACIQRFQTFGSPASQIAAWKPSYLPIICSVNRMNFCILAEVRLKIWHLALLPL